MGGHAGLLLQLRPAPGIAGIHHLPCMHNMLQIYQARAFTICEDAHRALATLTRLMTMPSRTVHFARTLDMVQDDSTVPTCMVH